ncbi:hypothetical protein [Sinisalibacter aestuarii]|uniref:Uncharacterized protein n=1 Tax=Sinisalibacter aestuarii TaxID=2949426 RepID=A0ABQ5LVD3_9RHOB|nr:hypothetical protein [Sinisalibacter aestuarii]GKY88949.1 hypothetical protein STA1M1_28180 [Sinisalibacter aestuarii]
MTDHDPRRLIAEAYNIEGIGLAECRSIFFDWAMSRPEGDEGEAISALLADHGAAAPDHPMTAVLREGLAGAARPKGRRGGRRGRLAH